MMLSDVAVRRPVLAVVAALLLCLVGLVAYTRLPLRELPAVDPPEVSVTTNYVGASAEVIETRITQPIERQLSGIQGIDRMTSSSRDGRSSVNLTFTLDRDIEEAANDVRDRVSRVLSSLPQDATAPTIAKAQADSQAIVFVAVTSPQMTALELGDYADRVLSPQFTTIDGVSGVTLVGAQTYAMHIWLDPQAMVAHDVSVEDVDNALRAQNVQLPAGSLEAQDKDFTINVIKNYRTPEDFRQLPIRKGARATTLINRSGGYVVRLGDVARIEESAADRRRTFRSNMSDQIGIGIQGQSQANDVEIAAAVAEKVKELNASAPKGVQLVISQDNAVFTREAVKEVYITLGIALALVAAVNFLFLGSWRAAIIPTVVAPICLLSTMIVLAPLGFSLNLLTLLALVLAIGLVVDDAIVVTENIQRRVDEGEPPAVAAQRGARQVYFAVIATTMVLIAVFAPLMFVPTYIGKLFIELAVTVAAAVAFSAFLALTLSPTLASKLLRPASKRGRISRAVDRTVDAVRNSYRHSLESLLQQKATAPIAIAVVAAVAAGAVGLFVILPKEVVPTEDRGFLNIQFNAPEGAGFEYTFPRAMQAEAIVERYRQEGDVRRYNFIIPGIGQPNYNGGFGFIGLTDWAERETSADELAARINRDLGAITGMRVTAQVRGPLQRNTGGGGALNVDLIITGPDYESLAKWSEPILAAARSNPGMTRVNTNYDPVSPRLNVTVDRDRAGELGITAQQVGNALNVMFGPRRSTTYVREGQEYDVLLQTDLERRRTIEDLETIYVRARSGELVPLSNVVNTEVRGDLAQRPRIDELRQITITSNLNPGYTAAQAVKFFEDEVAKQPPGPVIKWGGQARDLKESGNSVAYAFGFALVIVFLVLAAQFESFVHPAIIMLTVPLAACGGLFGLLMVGSSLNLYSQIGLIILIGVAAKNGILIVEFANQMRDKGMSIRDAVIESSAVRLRPIVMTSIATAAGATPLILTHGPGSGSRLTIGVVIFAGAMFSTLLTLFVVPVMYNLLARFTRSPEWTAQQIEAFEHQEANENARSGPRPAAPLLPEAAE